MAEDIADRLNTSIQEIGTKFDGGLSNTSTKKFDDLIQVVSDAVAIPVDDIYITSVVARASNVWNRLSQGKPLNCHFKLGVCIASASDVQGVLAPMGTFIGDGNVHYDSVAVIVERDGKWQVADIATNAKFDTALKMRESFPLCNVHIVNRCDNCLVEVVRLEVFSDLEEKFKAWLPEHDVDASAGKYVHFLRALGEDLDPNAELPHSGRWPGFYEYLTGVKPTKGVYEVVSAAEFREEYGLLNTFFTSEAKDYAGFDHQKYDFCFDYTHAAPSRTDIQHKDQRALLSAYRKYLVFLDELEQSMTQMMKNKECSAMYDSYLAAIRTKPFILLAGISGTGKSRLVRQLARGCCPAKDAAGKVHPLKNEQKPGNFEIIPVRPNWHDSTELMGYVTRITEDKKPKFVLTPFVRFLAKAWQNPEVPFFLCLDEMNLAPVEQYFAEYLSVIETRKREIVDGKVKITTDPLVRFDDKDVFKKVLDELFDAGSDSDLIKKFMDDDNKNQNMGIPIPQNLVVMGTVNMDETTFSFSRKVLDRAMSFELCDVEDMYEINEADKIEWGALLGRADQKYITAEDLYFRETDAETVAKNKEVGGKVLAAIKAVNKILDETPFKVAYRTRNEVMLYCIERTNYAAEMLPKALDEAISMKILSRVEGDSLKLQAVDGFAAPASYAKPKNLLQQLKICILEELKKLDAEATEAKYPVCAKKLDQMDRRLASGFTGFWQ